jgi:hypothetical protein
MQCRVVFMLYRPHGPRVVLSGSESNRVMSGSLDGLPVRPKHSMLVLQIGPGPFSTVPGRARARPNGAGLMPAHLTWAKFSKILCACAHEPTLSERHGCGRAPPGGPLPPRRSSTASQRDLLD